MRIEDALQTEFKSAQIKAIVNLRYTSNFLANIQNVVMQQYGLTMPQFNILRILRGANEAINVNTVKDRMIDKSPNTTRLMDKLIEKGLIDRTRCNDDRRVVFVQITNTGMKLLAEIDHNVNISELITANLSDEEATQMSDLLDKIRMHYE